MNTTPLSAADLDELDRRLATEVMGWQEFSHTHCWLDENREYQLELDDWHPTMNIAQAWECLEKIGRPVTIDSDGDCSWAGWSCWIAISSHEYAETAPLAIAMACLAAVSSADGLKK